MRVYIINHAESMNEYAANSLLKFLEEPAPNIVAILLADNQYQILDTIVSRCQVISLINSHSKDNQDTISKIASLLNAQSATFIFGVPAAVFTNPCCIALSLFPRMLLFYRGESY